MDNDEYHINTNKMPTPYVLVSVKHTDKNDKYIMFWRHDDCGYTYSFNDAGYYPDDVIKQHLDYYNNGSSTIAVPAFCVEKLVVAGDKQVIGQNCAAVENNWQNWASLNHYRLKERVV